jgi:hypothetical protein
LFQTGAEPAPIRVGIAAFLSYITGMKLLLSLGVFLVSAVLASAQPAKVILIRHAEKPQDNTDGELALKGKERAMALVPFLTENDDFIGSGTNVMLYATKVAHGPTNHTHETLRPLAAHLGAKIHAPFANSEYEDLAKRVLTDPSCKDKTVVICWTHAYIPGLLGALGVPDRPAEIDKRVFDRVYMITYKDGGVKSVTLPQRLMFGDTRL